MLAIVAYSFAFGCIGVGLAGTVVAVDYAIALVCIIIKRSR